MNPEQREQFRLSLLRYLEENPSQRFGLGMPLLKQRARAEGFLAGMTDADAHTALDAELLYLEDAKFIVQVAKAVSPELRTFRITKEGRDFRAQTA